jgi:hypothetical protein
MDKKHHIITETLLSTVISKDGTTLAFDPLGKGAVVLLVDGAMAYRDFRGSSPLAAELSKNFTAITFDQIGGGGARSRRDPGTVWRVFHPSGDWPTRRAVSWNHNHRSGGRAPCTVEGAIGMWVDHHQVNAWSGQKSSMGLFNQQRTRKKHEH